VSSNGLVQAGIWKESFGGDSSLPFPWSRKIGFFGEKFRPACHIPGDPIVMDGAIPHQETTMAHRTIATIAAEESRLTLINLYEVEPEKQADLARLLSEITETAIRHEPGFVSVSVHSSLDGTKVVNYAQWASKEHFEAFMKKPETGEQLKRFAALARSVSPALYTVNSVHSER